jgi:hypothetical protein
MSFPSKASLTCCDLSTVFMTLETCVRSELVDTNSSRYQIEVPVFVNHQDQFSRVAIPMWSLVLVRTCSHFRNNWLRCLLVSIVFYTFYLLCCIYISYSAFNHAGKYRDRSYTNERVRISALRVQWSSGSFPFPSPKPYLPPYSLLRSEFHP